MIKVCLIGNDYKQQFPLLDYGGIESCVENFALGINEYAKDDVRFCIIVPKILDDRGKKYDFSVIPTNYIESSKSGVHPFAFMQEVVNIINSSPNKPDIIWSQSCWSAKMLRGIGIPVISTMHDSAGWEENKFIADENIYYRYISKFIYDLTFKDADTNPYINSVKNHSFWHYTSLTDDEFDFCEDKEDYVLWVAGLNWGMDAKGLTTLIELAKRLPNQTFKVYGTGNDEVAAQLRKIQESLPNFQFLGKLERGEVHRTVFKKAKLSAMLSKTTEAFGRTNIEAMSKGTPVLGTMNGSIPELVNHDNVGVCTDNIYEMIEVINKKFDYRKCFEYSKKFHVKNEVDFMIRKSKEILKIV